MASRCNKVQKSMDTIIAEPRVTLNSWFSSKDVIILFFEVSYNFMETKKKMVVSA